MFKYYNVEEEKLNYFRTFYYETKNDKEMIGNTFKNRVGQKYLLIGVCRKKDEIKKYIVKFINTKYETLVYAQQIKTGEIKDLFEPSVCGVGYLGYTEKCIDKKLYNVWANMLNRCYIKSNKKYHNYGGRGVKVDEDWHNLNTFLSDVEKIDGWDREKFYNRKLELDKDINKLNFSGVVNYSFKNCQWVSKIKNCSYTKHSDFFKATKDGVIKYSHNRQKFARKHNIYPQNIYKCLKGYRNQTGGWRFKYVTKEECLRNMYGVDING